MSVILLAVFFLISNRIYDFLQLLFSAFRWIRYTHGQPVKKGLAVVHISMQSFEGFLGSDDFPATIKMPAELHFIAPAREFQIEKQV